MRFFFIFILYISFFANTTSAQEINIVIDIDNILVEAISKFDYDPKIIMNNRVIEVDNFMYVFYDGADETIKFLLKNQDIIITFFSSGLKQRNDKLISLFISQLFDENESIKMNKRIKILSQEDMTIANCNSELQPHAARFFGNGKKDLRILKSDMNWTILIDDDASYTVRDQEQNFLKVKGDNCLDNFEFWEKDQIQSRNHLIYALGIFLAALNQSQQNHTTLVQELHNIQFDDSDITMYGNYSNYEKPNQKVFYELGLNALKEINPNLELFLPNKLYPWNE